VARKPGALGSGQGSFRNTGPAESPPVRPALWTGRAPARTDQARVEEHAHKSYGGYAQSDPELTAPREVRDESGQTTCNDHNRDARGHEFVAFG
jgi:hypothetical protein